ncbi:MAG: nickel transporter [Betaproteobacteria bacterium]|nr:nickel transporter [Betaproteobacteria bacterium]
MESLNQDWNTIIVLVFLLGLKHGFDADHLATIDGLTRRSLQHNARLAGWCGTLFSVGHGAVVIAIAVGTCLLARHWAPPQWLLLSGAWISIGFLLALGLLNLHAVLNTPADQPVQLQSLKGRGMGRLTRTSHPLAVLIIGALFALSFDTVSLAALFALTAGRFDGVADALLLALLFMLGMLIADGANGMWIARLIRRANDTARIASRVLGLALGGMSLLVAAFGIAKLVLPSVDDWSDGKELALGLTFVVLIAGSYVVAMRLARIRAILSPRSR